MAVSTVPRFKSRDAALRLYFRAGELLAPGAKPGGVFSKRRAKPHRGPNLIDDFFALDACFRGLSEVQLWMLRELYRPGCFTVKTIKFTELCERLRRQFPDREWSVQQIAQFKREALKIFEARLMRERLM